MKNCSLFIKNVFENGWWGMHTPNSTSLDAPLAISYENYQKSLAYRNFSHLAPLISSFLLKGKIKRGTGGGEHGTMPSTNTLLTRRKSIIVMNEKLRKFFMHKSVCINSVWGGGGQKRIPLLYRHWHIARFSSLRLCEETAKKTVT